MLNKQENVENKNTLKNSKKMVSQKMEMVRTVMLPLILVR